MKKSIENIIVALVLILVVIVIGLVIRYNTISEDSREAFTLVDESIKEYEQEKKAQKRNYLDKLEQYEDVDVEVDPTQEKQRNVVKVTAEETGNSLEEAVTADETKAYAKQLESYSDEEESAPKQEAQLQETTAPKEENGDTIADDIEAIVGE